MNIIKQVFILFLFCFVNIYNIYAQSTTAMSRITKMQKKDTARIISDSMYEKFVEVSCSTCKGKGYKIECDTIKTVCSTCNGAKTIREKQNLYSILCTCSLCGGVGYQNNIKCSYCKGVGKIIKTIRK